MLIATSPRLSTVQEKNKAAEDSDQAIQMSSQCNSGFFTGHGEDEIHSKFTPTFQPTYESTSACSNVKSHLKFAQAELDLEVSIPTKHINRSEDKPSNQQEPGNLRKTLSTVTKGSSSTTHASTFQPGKFYGPLETRSHQREEFVKSSNITPEEDSKSIQATTVQSVRDYGSVQALAVLPEKRVNCSSSESLLFVRPNCYLRTSTDQSEELNITKHSSVTLSEDLLGGKSSDVCPNNETFQSEHLTTTSLVRLEDLSYTGQTISNSELLCLLNKEKTVQQEHDQNMEPAENRMDQSVNPGEGSTICFPDVYETKKTSTQSESERSYPSRTHDSHWSDSVTANKVAVEGDFNG